MYYIYIIYIKNFREFADNSKNNSRFYILHRSGNKIVLTTSLTVLHKGLSIIIMFSDDFSNTMSTLE